MGLIHIRGGDPVEARQITGTEFALGADVEQVRRAIALAQAEHEVAEAATEMVEDQAMRALQVAGLTVRQVAEVFGISKSEAGRRLKEPRPVVLNYPPAVLERIAPIIERIWAGATPLQEDHRTEAESA